MSASHPTPRPNDASDAPAATPATATDTSQADDHGHDHGHDHEHIRKHVRAYIVVGILLLVFTIITVALAFVDFGSEAVEIGIGLAVATIKAGLVAYIFMHLNAEKPLIYRILLFTIIFFIGLFALIGLAYFNDIPALF